MSGNQADTATGTATFTSTATAANDVGHYPINGSGLSGNFNFEQAGSNATALTITPRPITVTAEAKSKIYGDANPPLTFTTSSLGSGIAIAGALATTATSSSPANTYAITQGTVDNIHNTNYDITYVPANLVINPATLTLTYTANPATRAVGAADPTFSGTVSPSGLKLSDTLSGVTNGTVTWTTNAMASSPPGSYQIYGGGLTVIGPNYDLIIQQAASNDNALTITPAAGPGFNFPVFRVNGRGGPDIPVQLENQVGPRTGFLYIPVSTVTYDTGTNDARSVVISSTPDPANSPTPLTLTRGTAQSQVIVGTAVLPGQGPAPVPAYFLSSWSNGTVDYSAPTIAPGSFSLGANQAFQTIGWGYTGDLFLNPVSFGGNVLFNFEHATPAVWSDGQSAPGTFTGGQVAVAVGTTSLRYGMTGTVVMPVEGTFTMTTPGGLANPSQSGAIGLLSGQIARIQSSPNFGTNSPTPNVAYAGIANACPDGCYANMEFNIIAPGKIGVTYAFGDGQNFDNGNSNVEVTGIATFAQSGTSVALAVGRLRVVHRYERRDTGRIDRPRERDAPSHKRRSCLAERHHGRRGRDSYAEWRDLDRRRLRARHPRLGAMDRAVRSPRSQAASPSRPTGAWPWSTANLPPICLSIRINAPSPGLSVQYSLVGGTSPTVTNGLVAPGTLLNTSKIGIDFVNLKVGVDLFVGIGGGSYEMSNGGRRQHPEFEFDRAERRAVQFGRGHGPGERTDLIGQHRVHDW